LNGKKLHNTQTMNFMNKDEIDQVTFLETFELFLENAIDWVMAQKSIVEAPAQPHAV
jgi:hypothetical protein